MFGDLASEARENIRHDALCSFTGWSVVEFAEARIGFNKCAAIGVGVETSLAGDTSAGLTTLPSYAALARSGNEYCARRARYYPAIPCRAGEPRSLFALALLMCQTYAQDVFSVRLDQCNLVLAKPL